MAVNKNQMAGKRGANRENLNDVPFPILPKYNYSTGAGWKSKMSKEKLAAMFAIKRIIPGSGRTKVRISAAGGR